MADRERSQPPGEGKAPGRTDTQSVEDPLFSAVFPSPAERMTKEQTGSNAKHSEAEPLQSRGDGAWVFDRKAYERDMRLLRLRKKLRAYAALAFLGLAACVIGYVTLDRAAKTKWTEWTRPRTAVTTPAPPKKAVVEPQEIPKAKEMIERAIRGELDEGTMKSFKHFPEYHRCKQCYSDCEKSAVGSSQVLLEDCRRNCLRNCSDTIRQILDR